MFDTQVTVVGNLVADPRLSSTGDGQPVASFRIASTPRRFDRSMNEWRDGDTLYASVTCWRGLAENVAASLKKGQAAIVIGRLSVRPYATKEGEKRQSVEIDAMAVGPDLSRVITVVKRAERGTAPTPSSSGDQADVVQGVTWESIAARQSGEGVDPEHDADLVADLDADVERAIDREEGSASDRQADQQGDQQGDQQAPELVGSGGRLRARFGIG
jgi:single-strand DNA-binding protein